MANGPRHQGHYLVASTRESFYVRVMGLATMTNSVPLQEALEDGLRRGMRRFVFDLEGCSGFDSTFMGLLLGVARGAEGEGSSPAVLLVNASADHARLLAGVGIDRLVQLHPAPVRFPDLELRKLEEGSPDAGRRVRYLVSAHENLVRAGGKAAETFGPVLAALKREMPPDEPAAS